MMTFVPQYWPFCVVTDGSIYKETVMLSFDHFLAINLNKILKKQSIAFEHHDTHVV